MYNLTAKIPSIVIAFFFIVLSAAFILQSNSASAADIKGNLCGGSGFSLDSSNQCAGGTINAAGVCVDEHGARADGRCQGERSFGNLVTTVVNIFSVVVGIVAVIMIIVGGFKFITSGGDSSKVTSARNTIIYAIIGLVIVALAQVIVKFVLEKTPTG